MRSIVVCGAIESFVGCARISYTHSLRNDLLCDVNREKNAISSHFHGPRVGTNRLSTRVQSLPARDSESLRAYRARARLHRERRDSSCPGGNPPARRARGLDPFTQNVIEGNELSRLTTGQERAIAALTAEGRRDLTIADYVVLASVSDRTASRELNALVEADVLRARGTTRDRRFVLATHGVSRGGRPRTWSDERIMREALELADELNRWPSYRDFAAARKLALYAAIARTGGIDAWAKRLGYS